MAKQKIKRTSAKGKGRRLQQWVCQQISELTGFKFGKSGTDCPIESRPMGQSGCDVRMESQVLKVFPFSVECKYRETWQIHQWIEQAKENEMKGTNWILFAKRNYQDSVVIMDAEKFFKLLNKIKE